MVCWMTRGPAKLMRAPDSPTLMSPSMSKLAVTPPVVVMGEHGEMYSTAMQVEAGQGSAGLRPFETGKKCSPACGRPPEEEKMMVGTPLGSRFVQHTRQLFPHHRAQAAQQ